ncbi:hypothetical protein LDENG_00127560 [Lucifuga dentata]|nr:hypothetical protein LDENG_00127560 [Lucifuga dentata]
MLFIDYSSAFNTINPGKLTDKLHSLSLTPSSDWITDLLTGGLQSVSTGTHSSKTLTMNAGCPQGCSALHTLHPRLSRLP